MVSLRSIYPLQSGNKLVYSSVKQYEEPQKSTPSLSIKFSYSGTEYYEVERKAFKVNQGEYLLIEPGEAFYTRVDSETDVHGLCIDLNTELLSDIATAAQKKPAHLLDDPGERVSFSFLPAFHHKTTEGCLQQQLRQLAKWCAEDELRIGNTEFFYLLGELLLADHRILPNQASKLSAVKPATQKELLKRLLTAKEMMDASFTKELCILSLAKEACLSPFHFIRSYREAFGLTPHQYLLRKRMLLAKNLLTTSLLPVNEIAIVCGFANAPQFISQFKKRIGCTPKAYKEAAGKR